MSRAAALACQMTAVRVERTAIKSTPRVLMERNANNRQ